MNRAPLVDAMDETPPVPLGFLLATFGAATVIGIAIAYLGLKGQLGAGIP